MLFRSTYIIRNKDMNEQKLKMLDIFENQIQQYFTDSGLNRYMDRYLKEKND